MIKLAAKHYLKNLGDKFFVPNPNFIEWSDVNCLDIAVKRKPRWIWQKNIYTYDHLSLNTILDSPLPTDKSCLRSPELLTPEFSSTSKHSVKGKFGGKVASLVTLDVTGDDSISIDVDMKQIMKQSVDFPALEALLATKKVNFKNKYIRSVAHNKYNVICVVTQYIYLNEKTEIKVSVNFDLNESTSGTHSKVNVSEGEDFNSQHVKTVVFDAGTKLAFDFAECLINLDGTIELVDRSDDLQRKHLIPDIFDIDKSINYCAHITKDDANYDALDTKNKVASHVDERFVNILTHSLDITKNLLILAIENKESFQDFELFLLSWQVDSSDGQGSIDISGHDFKHFDHPNLIPLFKQIGLDVQNKNNNMAVSQLNLDVVRVILLKIQALYHLEDAYLKNLRTILENDTSKPVSDLFTFLQSLKINGDTAVIVQDNLIEDREIKSLLLSVGVTKDSQKLNKYFQPTLILLHGTK